MSEIIEMQTYYIYIIKCNDPLIKYSYVGSTKNFTRRMLEHKCNSKNNNAKLYDFIRNNGTFDNWNMTIIDTLITDNTLDVRLKEQEHIIQQTSKLNKINAYISDKDCLLLHKDYYILNRDNILQKKKTYYIKNKSIKHEYYLKNRARILQKQKQAYQLKKNNKNQSI
tara:strand:- start:2888 stop:3391 length:504 start_codon:yes stop_codon:yes gene_type:complete